MKKALQYLLPVLIAIALLRWVVKDLDLSSTLDNFKNANYFLVFLAAIIALASHISRAYRWRLMLEPMGYKPKLTNTSVAVLIGYLTNLVFPRAGEFARAASLKKSEDIPFEKSFGAVIAERVIDVLILGILVLLNLLLEFERVKTLFESFLGNGGDLTKKIILLASLGIVFLIALVSVFLFRKKLLEISIFNKIFEVVRGLWDGLMSVFKVQKAPQFLFHTLLIWSLYFLGTYVLCKAIPVGSQLGLVSVLTVFVMGSIGMAIPTQGGIGSYHLLVGKIVVLYGLSNQNGFDLATFLHTMQGIVFVIVFGLGALLFSFLNFGKR